MQGRQQFRYSVGFKQQVVEDLEKGRFHSINAASEHYGIRGTTTVRKWLVHYGKNHLIPKVVRVEKPNEADQVRQLKRQIQELQQALGQTQLEKVLGESFLRQACQQLGTDVETFKKKVATPPSPKPKNGTEGR